MRGFSVASIELLLSIPLIAFGTGFGAYHWIISAAEDGVTSAGTVMIAALPIIIGMQLLLSFIGHDIQGEPRIPLTGMIERSVL